MSDLTDVIDQVSAVRTLVPRVAPPRTQAQELLRLERLLEDQVTIRDQAAVAVNVLRESVRRLRNGLSYSDAKEYHALLRDEFHKGL